MPTANKAGSLRVWAAVALMAAAALNLSVLILNLGIRLNAGPLPFPEELQPLLIPGMREFISFYLDRGVLFAGGIGIVLNLSAIAAGWGVLRAKWRPLVWAGAVFVMLPIVSPACCVGVVASALAMVVASRPMEPA